MSIGLWGEYQSPELQHRFTSLAIRRNARHQTSVVPMLVPSNMNTNSSNTGISWLSNGLFILNPQLKKGNHASDFSSQKYRSKNYESDLFLFCANATVGSRKNVLESEFIRGNNNCLRGTQIVHTCSME